MTQKPGPVPYHTPLKHFDARHSDIRQHEEHRDDPKRDPYRALPRLTLEPRPLDLASLAPFDLIGFFHYTVTPSLFRTPDRSPLIVCTAAGTDSYPRPSESIKGK